MPVQRVWVRSDEAAPSEPRVQCGASILAVDGRTLRAWQRLTDPAAGQLVAPRPAPARGAPDGFLDRVSQLLADTPIVGSLAQLPWRGRH